MQCAQCLLRSGRRVLAKKMFVHDEDAEDADYVCLDCGGTGAFRVVCVRCKANVRRQHVQWSSSTAATDESNVDNEDDEEMCSSR